MKKSIHQQTLESYLLAINEHTVVYEQLRKTTKELDELNKSYNKSEKLLKAMLLCGQTLAEVLKRIDPEKYVVKSSTGTRYVVGISKSARNVLDHVDALEGTRVTLDTTTLTILRVLPQEINPVVYKMSMENPGNITFAEIGGLSHEIKEFQEVIKMSLENPDIFKRVGIKAPKGVLLYGPPGTGKTLLARAMASTLNVSFLKVVSSAIIEKYIGESSRLIREMFAYAKMNKPCIIFFDEIDAIGGKRCNDSTSSDREVQRTLMELLAQLDGFTDLDSVKVIMATNRPDILDEALLRPGRLDRKIEIPLPNDNGRKEIIKIHTKKMKCVDVDDELMNILVTLSADFNGADLRNLCTEAGMTAIRDEREYVVRDDFIKAVRKIAETKKLESKNDYKKK